MRDCGPNSKAKLQLILGTDDLPALSIQSFSIFASGFTFSPPLSPRSFSREVRKEEKKDDDKIAEKVFKRPKGRKRKEKKVGNAL